VIAVSGDDEVLHGIPSDRRLRSGELVKIQLGARGNGGTCDQGWTFAVGEIDEERTRLRQVGMAALRTGLETLSAKARVGDLGAAIRTVVEAAGFSCVRAFVGYGMGSKPLQGPQLPCVGNANTGMRFKTGMILHVHAIVAAGAYQVEIADDRWTTKTADGRPSALVTAVARVEKSGHEILTPLLT
jgi:methionyl aminopeptidase